MVRLESGKGRMMIDSVARAQYINVTDTNSDNTWQVDSYVTVANAVPMQYASNVNDNADI